MRKKPFEPLEPKVDIGSVIAEFVWECGDCRNIYTLDVQECPNRILDGLIVRGVIQP